MTPREYVRLALPDGHQQRPTIEFLSRTPLVVSGYDAKLTTRRPQINVEGVMVKVIRPQDMPLQVANSNFDLAITGQDWFVDHKIRFPHSPLEEVLDLGFGRVSVGVIVAESLGVDNLEGLKALEGKLPLGFWRIASEYVNIADDFARNNHFGRYKIIPTWGATEAFLPEDADLLIENAQTGATLARNRLKMIQALFSSTACLIANTDSLKEQGKVEKIGEIVAAFKQAISPAPAPVPGREEAAEGGPGTVTRPRNGHLLKPAFISVELRGRVRAFEHS